MVAIPLMLNQAMLPSTKVSPSLNTSRISTLKTGRLVKKYMFQNRESHPMLLLFHKISSILWSILVSPRHMLSSWNGLKMPTRTKTGMCLKMQARYSPAYLNRNNYLYNQDCPSSDRPMFGGGIVFFSKNIWFFSQRIFGFLLT